MSAIAAMAHAEHGPPHVIVELTVNSSFCRRIERWTAPLYELKEYLQ